MESLSTSFLSDSAQLNQQNFSCESQPFCWYIVRRMDSLASRTLNYHTHWLRYHSPLEKTWHVLHSAALGGESNIFIHQTTTTNWTTCNANALGPKFYCCGVCTHTQPRTSLTTLVPVQKRVANLARTIVDATLASFESIYTTAHDFFLISFDSSYILQLRTRNSETWLPGRSVFGTSPGSTISALVSLPRVLPPPPAPSFLHSFLPSYTSDKKSRSPESFSAG